MEEEIKAGETRGRKEYLGLTKSTAADWVKHYNEWWEIVNTGA